MSINRSQPLSSGDSSVFDDYNVVEGSSYSLAEDNEARRNEEDFNDIKNYSTYSWTKPYSIPLKVVRNRISTVNQEITNLLLGYENALRNVYLNPYIDPGLEESHFHIWDELYKNNKSLVNEYFPESDVENALDQTLFTGGSQYFDETTGTYIDPKDLRSHLTNKPSPDYIPFDQYIYAEEHGCRGCRKFVKDYDRTISHSTFVHLFDFRYFLKLLSNESRCIKESLLNDFGDDYEDESQQQTASFYFSWAEMASNYTKLIAKEFYQEQDELPASEVDNISKKQAAQFQAFFSIRVASYTEAVDNILFSLKKDLLDTCDIFYKRYISPSIKFKTAVAAPLQLDIQTTSLRLDAPTLSEEIITANHALKGSFGSVLSDMVQRRTNLQSKFDRLLSLNIQRKKYINYIDQLSIKATERPKVIMSVTDDQYSSIFSRIYIDKSEKQTLKSTHEMLDGLDEDHHPQYLLKSGGLIFGDIIMKDGVTIDGVDISEHSHTGNDGSQKIKSTDIDYDAPREENITAIATAVEEGNLEVSISSFVPDIRQGGVPVVDVILDISIPDDVKDRYEFEIVYVEN
jgi:hypothetical protein